MQAQFNLIANVLHKRSKNVFAIKGAGIVSYVLLF